MDHKDFLELKGTKAKRDQSAVLVLLVLQDSREPRVPKAKLVHLVLNYFPGQGVKVCSIDFSNQDKKLRVITEFHLGSVSKNDDKDYSVTCRGFCNNFEVKLTADSGDPDLYVKPVRLIKLY